MKRLNKLVVWVVLGLLLSVSSVAFAEVSLMGRWIWYHNGYQSILDVKESNGWQFGGQVSAVASDSVAGGGYQGAFSVSPGVWMYEMTDTGLALEATLKGTKYSKNDLN